MKVLSFFSAKGGTGKTTFNILLASYLAYVKGARVLYLDFDAPSFNACLIRENELSKVKDRKDYYPIQKVDEQTKEKILRVVKNISSLRDNLDYVVIDFRGSFSTEDAVISFARYGVLDKVVIPMELDNQSLSSANTLASIFSSTHQDVLLFFNRVYSQEKKELYDEVRRMFENNGHHVSEHMIYNTVKLRRDSGTSDNLRSSISFPSENKLGRNRTIVELFEEILG